MNEICQICTKNINSDESLNLTLETNKISVKKFDFTLCENCSKRIFSFINSIKINESNFVHNSWKALYFLFFCDKIKKLSPKNENKDVNHVKQR